MVVWHLGQGLLCGVGGEEEGVKGAEVLGSLL